MKSFILTIVSVAFCVLCMAQPEKAKRYIDAYKDIAIAEMQRSGVPASITLAQGLLESGMGESELCKKSNNHFGIKCKEEWKGEKTYHDDDERGECFRVYPSAAESYKDHSDFLKSRPWYNPLFKLQPTDFEGWAHGLKKAGYATEKKYPQQLIKIIKDYGLQQYTLLALNNTPNTNTNVTTIDVKVDTTDATFSKQITTTVFDEVAPKDDADTIANALDKPKEVTASLYPQGVFTINSCKVIWADAGTSLFAVANNYKVSLQKLIAFNELKDGVDILETSQLIFLQKKQKKGTKDFHVVEVGETLYDISQKEGVQLETIYTYNKVPKGSQVLMGEKVYLRSYSPTTPKFVTAIKK
jgi:LysM repeat protein